MHRIVESRKKVVGEPYEENLTYGSRWQGMEAKIWCWYLRHSQRKRRTTVYLT
jgi:hypothetical protein